MRDSKLFSLDRTLFPPVSSTVFAILLFALMMMADAPPFGRSNLPKANYPEMELYANDWDAIVVTVLHDGRVFWQHDPVSAGELLGNLNHISRWRPERLIYLAVDARASYKDLAGVLEVLQSAKVARVIFLVDQRKYWTSFVEDSQPHFWDPVYLWSSTDWLGRADFLLLAVMLANTGAILVFRLSFFNAARRQSRAFMKDAISLLREGKVDQVITAAARNRQSHLALIVGAGLAAYASAPPHFTLAEALAIAQRTYRRNGKLSVARAKAGLGTLSMIASSATLIGFLGTVYGILASFQGVSNSKATALAWIAFGLAKAAIPGSLGLMVSILALSSFNHLRRRVHEFEAEMWAAEADFLNALDSPMHWDERFEKPPNAAGATPETNASPVLRWEVPYDCQRPLSAAMWICVLYVAYVITNDFYWSWIFHFRITVP